MELESVAARAAEITDERELAQLRHAADEAIEDANRWVALEPRSPFAGRLVAMRTTDERRERLVGTRLEVTGADGSTEVSELAPAAALEQLQGRFRGVVDAREREELERLLGTAASR